VTRRLLLGYLGITLFVLVALEVPLGIQNQRTERRDITAKVEHDAVSIASLAEDAIRTGTVAQLRPIASRVYGYAGSNGSRVVIVDSRGFARIDTSSRVAGTESFASRPEIASALRGIVASGTRYSQTLKQRLLYVAVPIASGGVVHGAVRITYPYSTVYARIVRYWLILALIAAVVLTVAALLGFGTARFVTRPLRRLEHAAAEVGAGKLDVRAPENAGPHEVRSLASAFNETVSRLGRLLRSQEEFVADASHELRTPLTALQLRLESLERDITEPGRGDLEAALREVGRLSDMVEGLLALARADAEPSGPVGVAEVVAERVETWQALAQERGIALVAETDGAATARAAPQRLTQIIDNFVANALEVAPAGSTVTVLARAAGDLVEVRVRDRGPGLTAEERARAFDRFWRARSGGGGSGIGLAIVRKLAEADGATVVLDEAPGGGLDAVLRLRRAS
jgi:signal transduction histidine kinase